jgi:predicted ATPase
MLTDILDERLNELNRRLLLSQANKEAYNNLRTQAEELREKMYLSDNEHSKLHQTSAILTEYRIKKKKMDSNQITDTITSIANLIFPEYPYTYFLDGKQNGDYTHTELAYKDNKGHEYIPSISNGNGLQQLVSLSTVAVLMALSDTTPFLCMDERLNSLSPDRLPCAGEVLEQFTKYGFQMLIIEHPDELFENINYTEIQLGNQNGETQILGIREVNNHQTPDDTLEKGGEPL